MRQPSFGKNVSLKADNIETITGFMNKTRKQFSATLNIIIEQWDEFSVAMQKLQDEAETQERTDHFNKIQKAKPIKRVKKK